MEENGRKDITYKFVPGPFMRTYVNAWVNALSGDKPRPYLLIIEEINRASVAAVFGDVFQLLDRKGSGYSEYPVKASEDIRVHLEAEFKTRLQKQYRDEYAKYCRELRMPDNMFIWATMNSADQGVFPMDTAFKRRWNFTYIGINHSAEGIKGKKVKLPVPENSSHTQNFKWNDLRTAINDWMAEHNINEDKQLGPYFISKDIVAPEGEYIDASEFRDTFKNKVIMYLYEDAAKQKRSDLFVKDYRNKRYSEICEAFDEKGLDIFVFAEGMRANKQITDGTDGTTEDAMTEAEDAPGETKDGVNAAAETQTADGENLE